MTSLKIGDKVKIVKNKDGNIITYGGSSTYDYLNYIGTVEYIRCGSVSISGLKAEIDILCVELVSEETDKFDYNYLSKDKYNNIWLHKDMPVKGIEHWQSIKDIPLLGYINSCWQESLHKIEGDFNLIKINLNKINIDGEDLYVYGPDLEEIKNFIKSKILK